MKVSQPRRILILSPPTVNVSGLVKSLTGTAPTPDTSGSLAGTIHEYSISTAYYSADVPIWIDETSDIKQWASDYSAPEAKEVVQAIGGWIICLDRAELVKALDPENGSVKDSLIDEYLQTVDGVIEKACGYGWEGVKLLVATSGSDSAPITTSQPDGGSGESGNGTASGIASQAKSTGPNLTRDQTVDLDDRCIEHGFEFIDMAATGKNEFGERQGMERLVETLEANDWSAVSSLEDEDEDHFGLNQISDRGVGGFDDEEEEMNAELWGLKASLHDSSDIAGALYRSDVSQHDEGQHNKKGSSDDEDEALQVDNLEQLMSQALAIRESGADLPPEERKRYAARAINSLMKDM